MSKLFTKPKDMRWVDMAIWIDENFYKEDCDMNTAYSYMYLLANMLASKRRYFDNRKDYEEYSSILAYDTFKRMSDIKRGKIKSVLNYMKSIMSFRKMAYNYQKRQKIIDPVYDEAWDAVSYVEKCKLSYESSNSDILFNGIKDVLNYAPNIIIESIPKIYKFERSVFKNIYISCMLSMIERITLPNDLNKKLNARLAKSPSFDETTYYLKYLDSNAIILWHLNDEFKDLIKVILNKVNLKLVDEIKGLSNDLKISDKDFNNVLMSGFDTGDKNETNY